MTNLNPDGPGSFKATVERKGARVLVFEVGGVIDLGCSTLAWKQRVVGVVAGQCAHASPDTCPSVGSLY